MLFDVTITEGPGGAVVVAVVGEVDMSSAPRFRRELVDAITRAGDPPRIVVDLGGADLLDAVGLGVILEGVKRTRLRDGRVVLARPEPQVRRELELTRVDEIVSVFPTVDDAVDSLRD